VDGGYPSESLRTEPQRSRIQHSARNSSSYVYVDRAMIPVASNFFSDENYDLQLGKTESGKLKHA